MLFNSYEFLFFLLPLTLALYYVLRSNEVRLLLLTLVSYLFYGWWDYRFCGLMILTTVVDYAAGLGIHHARTQAGKKAWVLVSIVSGLSLIGFFKYYDLFAGTTNSLFSLVLGQPVEMLPILKPILPIGISFYTFHSMSYAIDVYRGAVVPARSFIHFSCFVSLFTQLVAGPIIRYRDMAAQLAARGHSWTKAACGVSFFVIGLVKKVILADAVAPMADHAFGAESPGLIMAWAGIVAYTMQIYFDFSGYSDMAVGLGYLFGFQIPQNFHSPYKAASITEFWRRWHISLSTWLRDYLYISLGGNRKGTVRTYWNLFLTMLLGGLWHGASWTFMFWGAYHGLLLVLERALGGQSVLRRSPRAIQLAFTFLLVMVGWVFFRAPTFSGAVNYLGGMAGLHGTGIDFWLVRSDFILAWLALPLTLAVAFGCPNTWEIKWRWNLGYAIVYALLFALCVAVMLVNSSSPFLYFQF